MMGADAEGVFRRLYDRHYDELWRYTARRVPTEAVASVLGDVFLATWRRLRDVPPEPDTRAWLYVVARNCIANQQRSQRRQVRLSSRMKSTAVAEEEASNVDIRDALARMSGADRELLRLLYWDDLTHADVARVLDLTENAVAIRAHRARAKLRGLLSGRKEAPAAGHEATMHEVNIDEQ